METLEARGLTKSYKGRKVVDEVSVTVQRGEIVGLLGPNGAGKTTTFSMILGLTTPDTGQVFLDDTEITEDPMYLRARNGIAYLPQEPSIFRGLTVEENLLAILETIDVTPAERHQRLGALLAELQLTPLAKSRGYSLSGGERRRTEITRCLVVSPSFILLDEPFAGIDPLAVLEIKKIIKHLQARGIGVIITDHNVRETLHITDRAYIINDGKIFRAGKPQELADDLDVKKVYLGENFRM
ncbi:MAG: LPS export ABC transporter ATP-binding protein [Acidobacteria bacterium]|nr:LPS export ABC transporter ATP-binding protein [Acidobacteriota bacterium]